MEQIHKQKLYCLIFAALAFIGLLLPWFSVGYGFFGVSGNGFRDWGLLSVIGVAGVAAVCWLGDKALPFDDTFKKGALASFGAIVLGALIFLFRIEFHASFGLWMTMIAGALGLAWVLGKISLPDINRKP